MPSRATPQVWASPALTWVKVPAGDSLAREGVVPQQARVPSVRTPQLCSNPALTWVKVPAGGLACPKSLYPQQARVPSRLHPAAMRVLVQQEGALRSPG